jgi:RNA polymerase sigma-70 factor (ECF subfamily)
MLVYLPGVAFNHLVPPGFGNAVAIFRTTRWSVVLRAGEEPGETSSAALEELCRTYWVPAYVFVRRRGYGVEDAQDLTQAFFAQLIAQQGLANVDRARGKFRSFLLACLSHFLAKDRRDRGTLKRGGGRSFLPLSPGDAEELLVAGTTHDTSPEAAFDQRWALAVLERALGCLRQEMAEAAKADQFEHLRVYLTESPGDNGYGAVAARLEMTPVAVATAVHRLRRRFRELVRETLAQTVSTPLELDEEMRYLLEVLAR